MPFLDGGQSFDDASEDLRFASSVAAFGMLLRDSKHRGEVTWRDVLRWALESQGRDVGGYRIEFVELVTRALRLSGESDEPLRKIGYVEDIGYLGDEEKGSDRR